MTTLRERILAALEAEREMYAREVGAIGIEIVDAAIDIVERELPDEPTVLLNQSTRLPDVSKKPKPVDLSVCIESGIDMEFLVNFGATEYWVVAGPLREINSDGDYYFDSGPAANCRPRMEHWMVWQGGECPVPEGVMGNIMLRDGTVSPDLRLWTCYWEHGGYDGDIIAWRATRLADGYCWPWEAE